jgi:hypothetical protein
VLGPGEVLGGGLGKVLGGGLGEVFGGGLGEVLGPGEVLGGGDAGRVKTYALPLLTMLPEPGS